MARNGIFNDGVFSCGWDFSTAPGATGDFLINGGGVISSANAFGAGQGIQQSGSFWAKNYGVNLADTTWGVWYKTTTYPSGGNYEAVCVFYDTTAGAAQLVMAFDPQGHPQLFRGGNPYGGGFGTPIGALGSYVIPLNTWVFIEARGKIGSSSGIAEMRVAGSVVATFAGNTQATANAYANQFAIGETIGGGVHVDFDHLYGLDMTGSSPLNTYLGPGRVQTDEPTANSATIGLNQFAPTNPTNVNWSNVANNPASLTEYNSSNTVGQRESYQFPTLSAARVFFLNEWISAELDAAGSHNIQPTARYGTSDSVGTTVSLGGGYSYFSQPYVFNPATGLMIANSPVAQAQAIELGLILSS